jgi:hypothetical protein
MRGRGGITPEERGVEEGACRGCEGGQREVCMEGGRRRVRGLPWRTRVRKWGGRGKGGSGGVHELVESCEGRVCEMRIPPPPPTPLSTLISIKTGTCTLGQQDDHKHHKHHPTELGPASRTRASTPCEALLAIPPHPGPPDTHAPCEGVRTYARSSPVPRSYCYGWATCSSPWRLCGCADDARECRRLRALTANQGAGQVRPRCSGREFGTLLNLGSNY